MGMRSSGPRLLVGHDVGHCILSVVTGIDCGRLQSVLADIDRYCLFTCLFQTLLTNELVLWVLSGGWAMGMRSSGPRLLVGHDVGHCILSVVTGIDCGRLQYKASCVVSTISRVLQSLSLSPTE